MDLPDTRRVVGASILPFSVDPRWSTLYFWLAQERFCAAWPAGSLAWTDFGGAVAAADDGDAFECAAREFHEESMGALPILPDETTDPDELLRHGARRSTSKLAAHLRSGGYTLRINTVVSQGHVYVTFVKQVPWMPEVHDVFRTLRDQARDGTLSPSHAVVAQDGAVPDVFREKNAIQLFSFAQVQHMITRMSGVDRVRAGCQQRIAVILDQFPETTGAHCVPDGSAQKITLETYQRLPLPNEQRINDP